jgi:cleavage and polyadenylation specificity factor subunit 3
MTAGSASQHSHSHSPSPTLPTRNLHANLTPEERLSRLFMFLEAQFGADNVSPIAEPKLPPEEASAKASKKDEDDNSSDASMDVSDDEDEAERALARRRDAELARLHRIGIPVPGVLVKVDKMEAKVWLEDLDVECPQKAFADRVRAVVERAAEVTAPLWG